MLYRTYSRGEATRLSTDGLNSRYGLREREREREREQEREREREREWEWEWGSGLRRHGEHGILDGALAIRLADHVHVVKHHGHQLVHAVNLRSIPPTIPSS